MKKISLLLILLSSSLILVSESNAATFVNSDGCNVEKEDRGNGTVLYISKGTQRTTIGYTNDYQSGDFAYCADQNLELSYYRGNGGTGIIMSCREHQNGNGETRGRVDISNDSRGNPYEVIVSGEKKGLFGWKEEISVECFNLVEQ